VSRERISLVIPIALEGTGRDDNDLERLSMFLDTFLKFFDRRDLGDFLIVTRPQDIAAVEQLVATKGMNSIARIRDENEIVPELRSDPATDNPWPRPNKGWQRQQLIKLACHAHVSTEFYLTGDADVLFVKPFEAATLIQEGRAVVNVQSRSDYEKLFVARTVRHQLALGATGHMHARRVLGLSRQHPRPYLYYGITPVVLSRSIVARMAEHIAARYEKNWREALIEQLPWWEYPLYFTFAEATGALAEFYRIGGFDSVMRASDGLLWPPDCYRAPRTLQDWTLGPVDNPPEGVAVVVQSHLGYSVEDVRRAAERVLGISLGRAANAS
jgi:hypothetical protein